MTGLKTLIARLRDVRRKPELDEQLSEEVRFHLEMQTAENMRRGMTPEEARYAALRQFGGVEQRKEEWRDLRFLPRLEAWWQDVHYAIRAVCHARAYALFAVLSLALGIGANTAIFTLVRSVLARSLPYPEPEELVRLVETSTWMGSPSWGSVSVPNLKDWREQSSLFEAMGAYSIGGVNLTSGEDTLRVAGAHVESEVFGVMGVQPLLGRVIAPDENTPGRDRVVVLSHGLWTRRFGADPDVVGTKIAIDGAESVVIGVMPEGFQLPPRSPMELWTPIVYRDWALHQRGSHWLNVIGRLKTGVNLNAAQQELSEIARHLRKLYKENATRGARIAPLDQESVRGMVRILGVLWLAVAFVLLLACANVAHLVLARVTGRRRELALRSALGASRWRLVRLFLIEGLLLSGLGSLVAFLAARWSMDGLLALAGEKLPSWVTIEWDASVLLFCAGAAVLSAVLTGLIPALGATRIDLTSGLKEAGSATGRSLDRSRSALMVWEVALTLVLVVGALALFRSLRVLNRFDLGFDHRQVLTMKVTLPEARYVKPREVTEFYQRAVEKVRAIPGVSQAAVINLLPVREYHANANLSIRGRARATPGHEPAAEFRLITPAYFQAMGIPMVYGRHFTDADLQGKIQTVVINQRTAELYWPGQNPVGQWIAIGTEPEPDSWMRIVGVAGNVRHAGPYRPVLTAVYLPASKEGAHYAWPTMNLVLRSSSDPENLAMTVRRTIRELDPDVAVYLVKPMEVVVSEATSDTRVLARLLTFFSGLAIVLALVGVYGVMAYLVSQRSHEIGVRMTLGAERHGVLKLVLNRGLRTGLIGVAMGMSCTVPMLMVARHYLVGVNLSYLWTYAAAAAGALAVTAAASIIPAWRASHIDPLDAIREE